jgi:hypothetical protein
MWWLNVVVHAMVDVALWPFRPFAPAVGLAAIALAVSIAISLVVRATSDQSSIVAVKRRIQAGLFEIRLFNDDVRAMFRATQQILRAQVVYFRLTSIPMLWLAVPSLLLLVHLQFYYGYEGLEVGAHTIVTVRLEPSAVPLGPGEVPDLSLEAPPGLRVETPFVWIPSAREAAWRIAAEQSGDYHLVVILDGKPVTKHVHVSRGIGFRSPARVHEGLLDELLAPAEPPIDGDAPISSIHVSYPERRLSMLGVRLHWMVPFLVFSIVFTLALRRSFGVAL